MGNVKSCRMPGYSCGTYNIKRATHSTASDQSVCPPAAPKISAWDRTFADKQPGTSSLNYSPPVV
eukprot:scaffold328851_cov16-Prasinocladus_malaysianus.AAC.1